VQKNSRLGLSITVLVRRCTVNGLCLTRLLLLCGSSRLLFHCGPFRCLFSSLLPPFPQEAKHGAQPLVAVKGQGMVPPALLIKYEGNWYYWEAGLTVAQAQLTSESEVKYQDITDQLAKLKRFSNIHWAASNGAVLGGALTG